MPSLQTTRVVPTGQRAGEEFARAAAGQPREWADLRRARRWLLRVLALVVAYYAAAHVGYALEFAGPVAAVVWPPVGVAIAFVYYGGPGLWPGVIAGDLLVNDYAALPLGTALAQTCGNLLEVLVVATLLRALSRRRSLLADVRGIAGLVLAIAVGTAVSATIGVLSAWAGGVLSDGELGRVWRTWWLGDASGALVIVPAAIAWRTLPLRASWRERGPEAALLVIALVAVAQGAFSSERPLAYLVFPPLLWAALRFGQRGATAAIVLTTGVAVWNATHYLGPFTFQAISHMILLTQLFIAVSAVSTLVLAAVVTEREDLAARLDAMRIRVEEAADAARQRIERDLHDGAQGRLTALAVRLGIAADRARRGPVDATALLAAAQRELGASIEEIRLLSHGVQPSVLTEHGLREAMVVLAGRTVVPVRLDLPDGRLNGAAEAAAYFVLAEAVTNAVRHADATYVDVRAELRGSTLHIDVADDGVGGAVEFDGNGLSGLRDRVEAIGGRFDVASPSGDGTRLHATIPTTHLG